MPQHSLKAVFFGTPALAIPALRACNSDAAGAGIEVSLVCTRPPSRAGRGRAVRPSAIAELAAELGIQTITPHQLDSEAAAAMADVRPDVAIVVAYGRLIPDDILQIPTHGAVNLHPSLLPKHRGTSPVQTAILSGDEFTGASIILLDSGMDSGPVLWQSTPVPILRDQSAVELSDHLFDIGGDNIPRIASQWCAGDIEPMPQDDSEATFTKLLKKQDGELDWSAPAEQILRANRAYQPWPGTYTKWNGANLNVRSFAVDTLPAPSEQAEPGTVWTTASSDVHVTAGDGQSVTIEVLQLEGRGAMSANEFVRGRPDFIGARLGT